MPVRVDDIGRDRPIREAGAGHGNGLYLLDKEGAPLLAIQSLDSRAAGLAADGNGVRLHAICPHRGRYDYVIVGAGTAGCVLARRRV